MPVTSISTTISYSSDGIKTTFSIPFYFIQQQDLLVQSIDTNNVVKNYTLNNDYSITGTPNLFGDYNNGGNVVFNTAPVNGLTIVITRQTQRTNTIQLYDNSPYTADTFNHVFDKLTLIVQESVVSGYKGLALGPPTLPGTNYVIGDWFKNSNPKPGGVWGWICTTAGNPGTWNAMGPVSL